MRSLLIVLTISVVSASAQGPFMNGFDLAGASIPISEIQRGGPPRDGIPSIDDPQFLDPSKVTFLDVDDPVIGVKIDGVARAYPLRILVWHEVVNDEINGKPIVVTYCPLCGTSMVFEGVLQDNGEPLSFGVSGLLFRSDVLMYDRQTESLWSQLSLKAVSGPMKGAPLKWMASDLINYGSWVRKHRKTGTREVLSTQTGADRDYTRNPYTSYNNSNVVWFVVPENRSELADKSWILGLIQGNQAKAYPINSLTLRGVIRDKFAGRNLEIRINPGSEELSVLDLDTKELLPYTRSFWLA